MGVAAHELNGSQRSTRFLTASLLSIQATTRPQLRQQEECYVHKALRSMLGPGETSLAGPECFRWDETGRKHSRGDIHTWNRR